MLSTVAALKALYHSRTIKTTPLKAPNNSLHSITVIMFILYFQFHMLIIFPIVVCRVFWAGGLSLHY